MEWIEQIKPKSIYDINIYQDEIKKCIEWIKAYKEDSSLVKKALLIIGDTGVGKTLIAELLFKEFNYDKIEINSSDYRSQKKFGEFLKKTLCFKNVIDLFNNEKKPIGLLLDEIDTMCISNDKGGLSEFIQILKANDKTSKNIEKKKKIDNYVKLYNPIICTCININDKKINELKKFSQVINIKKITFPNFTSFIKKILKDYTFENKFIKELYSYFKTDVRFLTNTLNNMLYGVNDKKITIDSFNDVKKYMKKKENDIQLIEANHNIFNKKLNINESSSYYQLETFFLPFMIHQNLFNFLNMTSLSNNDKIEYYSKTLDSICNFDIVQNFSFDVLEWYEFTEYQSLYGVHIPNYILNNKKYKKYDVNLEFSTIMNKISQALVNKKFVNNSKYSFKKLNIEIDEVLYVGSYIIEYFYDFKSKYDNTLDLDNNKNINHNLINFMNKYNMNIEDLEIILKLEKLNNGDDKIKKHFNNNLKKIIENNLNY